MDIEITTSDPQEVAAKVDEIALALEGLDLFVGTITVCDRYGVVHYTFLMGSD